MPPIPVVAEGAIRRPAVAAADTVDPQAIAVAEVVVEEAIAVAGETAAPAAIAVAEATVVVETARPVAPAAADRIPRVPKVGDEPFRNS